MPSSRAQQIELSKRTIALLPDGFLPLYRTKLAPAGAKPLWADNVVTGSEYLVDSDIDCTLLLLNLLWDAEITVGPLDASGAVIHGLKDRPYGSNLIYEGNRHQSFRMAICTAWCLYRESP